MLRAVLPVATKRKSQYFSIFARNPRNLYSVCLSSSEDPESPRSIAGRTRQKGGTHESLQMCMSSCPTRGRRFANSRLGSLCKPSRIRPEQERRRSPVQAQQNPDPVTQTILSNAGEAIQEVRLRCEEALDHLGRAESLGAIGALAGVDERVRYVITILQVLQKWQASQNKS